MEPTIIFLHGGPGFQDYLKPFFEDLGNDFECVFYDQVHGPEIKIENLLLQLDEIIRSIPGKIILLGHSWGAVLATEYAGRNQSKLSGLVLMSTGLTDKHWKDEYYKELEDLGLENAELEKIFLTPEEVALGETILDKVWDTFSEETFNSIKQSYLGKYDVTPLLKSLKIPIINIYGEKDVRFPARVSKTFGSFNSNMIDFQISNAGHFPFLLEAGRMQIYKILKENFL
ncbi:MAG: alpha/beta hydrolase [Bacteriovorax sp.]|nr:alpha/beta hydrolase [Bacteriovorax sp.]